MNDIGRQFEVRGKHHKLCDVLKDMSFIVDKSSVECSESKGDFHEQTH